jgi:hypothetical protein
MAETVPLTNLAPAPRPGRLHTARAVADVAEVMTVTDVLMQDCY